MAWFRNYYRCSDCREEWDDEWCCTCVDDCPHCGERHMSPYESEDLTEIIRRDASAFVVLRSRESAEHAPDYEQVASFPTIEQAAAYLSSTDR
jgi:hypothetical protein